MHLLAAKPGGFVDEEGIIDLNQSPAQIVILSAADSSLSVLAEALETSADLPTVRLANWMQLRKPAAFDLYQETVLDHAQLVLVSLLGGKSYWPYGIERLQQWAQGRNRHLIIVPGDDSPDPELQALSSCDPQSHFRLWRYLRESGLENARHLLNFLAAHFFHQPRPWREPLVLPSALIYNPSEEIGHSTLQGWQRQWDKNAPVAVLLFYRSHLLSGNAVLFAELIELLQAHGINPLPIAISSLKEPQSLALVNNLLLKSSAKLILNSLSFASNPSSAPELSSEPSLSANPFVINLPVIQLILASSTEEDWQQQQQGLRSRDLAMQVVLPEMDGRIISRAIAFKTSSHYSQQGEIALVRYQLHKERAEWIAQLSRAYLQLSEKTNGQKRIATATKWRR